MLSVPPALLEVLGLKAGETVGVLIEGQRLVVEPQKGPHYTLDELLEQCDCSQPCSAEDQGWLSVRPVGLEE